MSVQVAKLKAINAQLPVLTPEIVHYDVSENNLLEMPYMIQKRDPGIQVGEVIDSWSLEQQRSLLHGVINIVNQIMSQEALSGNISIANLTSSHESPICIEKVTSLDEDYRPSIDQVPLNHLLEIIEVRRKVEIGEGCCFYDIWVGFTEICKSLEARGYLEGPSVLVHGDLHSYNLLAEATTNTVNITGVIDWDDAYFAPKVMAARPPFWIWTDNDDWTLGFDGTEQKANTEPVYENDRFLRQKFLANVSDEYKRLAFDPEAVLARRMYYILRNGLCGDWECLEAQHIIDDWNELPLEDHVKFGDGYFNEDYSWKEGASEKCIPPYHIGWQRV